MIHPSGFIAWPDYRYAADRAAHTNSVKTLSSSLLDWWQLSAKIWGGAAAEISHRVISWWTPCFLFAVFCWKKPMKRRSCQRARHTLHQQAEISRLRFFSDIHASLEHQQRERPVHNIMTTDRSLNGFTLRDAWMSWMGYEEKSLLCFAKTQHEQNIHRICSEEQKIRIPLLSTPQIKTLHSSRTLWFAVVRLAWIKSNSKKV